MNNALVFLGIALAIAIVGGVVVMLLHRNPEAASTDGVDQFQRIMDALAPDDAPPAGDDRSTKNGER
ncbi:MAG: hypothetical protein U0Q22_03425 [Acidimicrobiales bacterium]